MNELERVIPIGILRIGFEKAHQESARQVSRGFPIVRFSNDDRGAACGAARLEEMLLSHCERDPQAALTFAEPPSHSLG